MEILSELQAANRLYTMVVSDVTFGEAGIVVTAHQVRDVVEAPDGAAVTVSRVVGRTGSIK